MTYLIVFFGGGIGAALRHGVNIASARLFGTAFPYATMIENVSGSLVMGLLAGYFAFRGGGAHRNTGSCSSPPAFSAATPRSRRSRSTRCCSTSAARSGLAALYVLGSVVLSIAGLVAGLALARHVF